ncbi:MAG: glycine cleavage T C-terminal barrel domain-containing protein, partial [Spongiibacter marinus]
GRAPVREHSAIVNADGERAGEVCSGGFGPSTGGPLAMAYIACSAMEQQALFAELRGKKIPVAVRSGSFVPQRYYRG